MSIFDSQISEQEKFDKDTSVGQEGNFKDFTSGAGTTIFAVKKDGVFAGGENFDTATWALDYTGKQYIGQDGQIQLDGVNNKIIIGGTTGTDIVIDGSTGTITTDKIKDKTYGLNGVFCSTHFSSNTSGNYSFRIDGPGTSDIPTNGGLLNVTLNYTDSSGNYKLLPGFDTASSTPFYYTYKLDGYYRIFYYAGNIYGAVAHTGLYFTSFFNSLETSGW